MKKKYFKKKFHFFFHYHKNLLFIICIRTLSKSDLVIQRESVYDGFYDSSMKVEDRSSVQNKVKKEGLSPQRWHNCHFDLSIEGRSATSYNILGYFMVTLQSLIAEQAEINTQGGRLPNFDKHTGWNKCTQGGKTLDFNKCTGWNKCSV